MGILPILRDSIKDFTLACAILSSSRSSTHELLSWIPTHLSSATDSAFADLSAYSRNSIAGGDSGSANEEEMLVLELMPEVLPVLKERMKESSIDKDTDGDEVSAASAASARVPVGYAILAAYQLRWFVTQVGCPHLGKLSALVIPCGLTALDHWSPEVKDGQSDLPRVEVAIENKFPAVEQEMATSADTNIDPDLVRLEKWQKLSETTIVLNAEVPSQESLSPLFELGSEQLSQELLQQVNLPTYLRNIISGSS